MTVSNREEFGWYSCVRGRWRAWRGNLQANLLKQTWQAKLKQTRSRKCGVVGQVVARLRGVCWYDCGKLNLEIEYT